MLENFGWKRDAVQKASWKLTPRGVCFQLAIPSRPDYVAQQFLFATLANDLNPSNLTLINWGFNKNHPFFKIESAEVCH